MESNLQFQLKLYNGKYIDNWMILNVTLDINDIKDALEIYDEQIDIKGSILATLTHGKYFDTLVMKSCKISRLSLQKNKFFDQLKEGLLLQMINTTCFYQDHLSQISIFFDDQVQDTLPLSLSGIKSLEAQSQNATCPCILISMFLVLYIMELDN